VCWGEPFSFLKVWFFVWGGGGKELFFAVWGGDWDGDKEKRENNQRFSLILSPTSSPPSRKKINKKNQPKKKSVRGF
jgi:hypothetical protein